MKRSKDKKKNAPQTAPEQELAMNTEQEAKAEEVADAQKEASPEEKAPVSSHEEAKAEELPVPTESKETALKIQEKPSDEPMSDEEAYQVLGPQSIVAHLVQLVLAPIPMISVLFTFLWILLGGTVLSVGLVAGAGAVVLAVFAFWAFGGCINVNRRRFARAYFLSLGVMAAATALFILLASGYGADLSPVLRKIMNTISSLNP